MIQDSNSIDLGDWYLTDKNLSHKDEQLHSVLQTCKEELKDEEVIFPQYISSESTDNGYTIYTYKLIDLEMIDISIVDNLIYVFQLFWSIYQKTKVVIGYPFMKDKSTKKLVIMNIIKDEEFITSILYILIKAVNRHIKLTSNFFDKIPNTCIDEYKYIEKEVSNNSCTVDTMINNLKNINIQFKSLIKSIQIDQSHIGIINDSGLNVRVLLDIPWKGRRISRPWNGRITKSFKIKSDDLNLHKVLVSTNRDIKMTIIIDGGHLLVDLKSGDLYTIKQGLDYIKSSKSKSELFRSFMKREKKEKEIEHKVDWCDLINPTITMKRGIMVKGESIKIENHLSIGVVLYRGQTRDTAKVELPSGFQIQQPPTNSIAILISTTHHRIYHYRKGITSNQTIIINQLFLDSCQQFPPIPIKLKCDVLIYSIIGEVAYLQKYIDIDRIAYGEYGEIKLALYSKGGDRFKLANIKSHEFKYENEISTFLVQACHENIIKTYDISENTESQCIVTEHCDHSTLNEYIKNTNPTNNKRVELLIGVCNGMMYLHYQDIIHRDIKPNNVMVDKYGTPKIIFGHTPILFGAYGGTLCGTPGFVSPETLLNRYQEYDGKKADIYSFGVTMLSCLLKTQLYYNNYSNFDHFAVTFFASKFTCQYRTSTDDVSYSIACKLCADCQTITNSRNKSDRCKCQSADSDVCCLCEEGIAHDICHYKYKHLKCDQCKQHAECPRCKESQCNQCKHLQSIIMQCISIEPDDRPSLQEIINKLQIALKDKKTYKITIHNSTNSIFHFSCGSSQFSLRFGEKIQLDEQEGFHIYAIKQIGDKKYNVTDSSLDYSTPSTIDCRDIDFGVTLATFNVSLIDRLKGLFPSLKGSFLTNIYNDFSNIKEEYIQDSVPIEDSKWFEGRINNRSVWYHYDKKLYQKTKFYDNVFIGKNNINFKEVYVYEVVSLPKIKVANQKSILHFAKNYTEKEFYFSEMENIKLNRMDFLDIKDIKHKSMIMFAFNLIQILYNEIKVDIRGWFNTILSPSKLLSYLPFNSNNDYINLIKRIINQVSTISFNDIITTLEGIKSDSRMTFKRESTLLVCNQSGYDVRVMARVPWKDRFIIKSLDIIADNRAPVYFKLNNNNNNIKVMYNIYCNDHKGRYFNRLVQDGVLVIQSNFTFREGSRYEPKYICKQLLKGSKAITPIKNQLDILQFQFLIDGSQGVNYYSKTRILNCLSTNASIYIKDRESNSVAMGLKSCCTHDIRINTPAALVLIINDKSYNHFYYYYKSTIAQTININQSFIENSEYIVSIPSHLKTEDLVNELLKGKDFWDSVEQIRVVGVIGSGVYGRVDLILQMRKNKKRRLVAIKYLFNQSEENKEIKMNDTILQLYHRNLIKVYDINQEDNTITMEYAHQGTLVDYIKRCSLTSNQVIELMIGVCKGIKYLHNQDIIHHNIKPNNIVIDKYRVPKICDFCTSNDAKGIGTPGYIAPEIQEGLNFGQEYDGKAADVYAFGVTLLVVMMGGMASIKNKRDVQFYSTSIHCSNNGDIKCKQCIRCTKIQQQDICRCTYMGASCKECDSNSNHDGNCSYSYYGDNNGIIKVCEACHNLRECKSCVQCMKCKTISQIIKLCTNYNINIRPTFKQIVSLLKYSLISSSFTHIPNLL